MKNGKCLVTLRAQAKWDGTLSHDQACSFWCISSWVAHFSLLNFSQRHGTQHHPSYFIFLTGTGWGDTGLILKNTLPAMWGIVWQEELPSWQAPDSRFVDFMVTSFKVTTGWSMPSDNLLECWLWKALSISASSHNYWICSPICEGLSSLDF